MVPTPNATGLGDILVRNPWTAWIPILVGLVVLFLPTYVSLSSTVWNSEEQGHGPLILLVVVWLFWQSRDALTDTTDRPAPVVGWTLLMIGIVAYVLGRSQDIYLLEVGSHIPILGGVLLVMRGANALKVFWFAIAFLIFMVPLPGALVDALTGPLKRHISTIAEHLLYTAGYPIARSGVTLTIGPYQLLVADACSGLHSLFSLSALGLLYLHLMKHKSIARNALLAAAILPIAFGANIIRVIFLVLVTYYFGDEAGQGFLHGFAGMVLFVAALLFLFLIDTLLGFVFRGDRGSASSAGEK